MIYALWHGGGSYALGSLEHDLEIFSSLREARDALRSRESDGNWDRKRFDYADGRTEWTYTPCGDQTASMTIWFADPRKENSYPDRQITFGPRGGIRIDYT